MFRSNRSEAQIISLATDFGLKYQSMMSIILLLVCLYIQEYNARVLVLIVIGALSLCVTYLIFTHHHNISLQFERELDLLRKNLAVDIQAPYATEEFSTPMSVEIKSNSLESVNVDININQSVPVTIPVDIPFKGADPYTLIVGGTDGSGTRRVVQILCQLGVTMVSEDPETYDIHADIVGGWPVIAHPVLRSVKSLDFNIHDLPKPMLDSTLTCLKAIISKASIDSHKKESHTLAVGGVLSKSLGVQALSVEYGIKAPVSMIFIPLWHEVVPRLKFLHVLRDGPIDKFYADFYKLPDNNADSLSPPLKAIKLWSDWNTQLYDWSLKTTMQHEKNDPQENPYDYFVLNVEDIVSSNIEVRYNVLQQLAIFVGSNISTQNLCCVARNNGQFLGSHDRTDRESFNADQVASRYGKWKQSQYSAIVPQLQNLGSKGLKLFGYEPFDRSFLKVINNIHAEHTIQRGEKLSSRCDLKTALKCDINENINKRNDLSAKNYSNNNQCVIAISTDYKTNEDIQVVDVSNQDPSSCCQTCKSNAICKYFTINTNNGLCYLKSVQGTITRNDKTQFLVSGSVL